MEIPYEMYVVGRSEAFCTISNSVFAYTGVKSVVPCMFGL